MTNLNLYLKFITAFIFVVSCEKKNQDLNIKTILPLEMAITVDNFKSIVDTIIFIPVKSDSINLISEVSKILVDDNNNIIILDHVKGVKMLDLNGAFLRHIGAKGRGPGEYHNIDDLCISSDGEHLLILQQTGVLKYRIFDGKFVDKINLGGKNYDAICSSEANGFFLFSSNPSDESCFEEPFNALTHFDSKGNKKRALLPRKDFVFTQGIFTQSYDKSTIMRPQEGDNIAYKIKEGVIPFLKIDFQEKAVPLKYIFKNGDDLFQGMKKYLYSDYYKLPIHIHDTKDYIYFSSIGPNALQNDFIFSKNSNKGIQYVYDRSVRYPLFIMASDSIYFYTIIYNEKIDKKEVELKTTTLRDFILQKLTEIPNCTQETYIVKLKFKIDEEL